MRKIRDVLRYRHSAGLSLEAIARALKISKGVVAKYVRLATAAGLSWPIPESLDDVGLEKLLYQQGAVREPTFATCQWIHQHQNLVLTGATGCGKTWLACAFGNAACRQGLSVAYVRTPRLFEELRIAHGDGSFGKRLTTLAKTDLLILDDWGLAPLNQSERNDLLEVLDDRVGTRSTLITSQLPPAHWHAYLNDPTLADAILDRVLHAAHKVELTGESLRKPEKSPL